MSLDGGLDYAATSGDDDPAAVTVPAQGVRMRHSMTHPEMYAHLQSLVSRAYPMA